MAFYQKILNNGESFSEGSDPGGNNETKDSYTYTVKEGHYVMVTRIWQDKIEWGDSKVEPYTVDNVKEYITSGGVKKPTKTTSARYSQTGSIYNCKGYELTEDQITTVSQVLYAEFGYNIEGAKNVASQMCNLYEKSGSKSSFFDWLRSGGGKAWYAGNRNSGKTNDDMKEAVRQCIVEGKRTLPPFVDNFVTYASKWVTPYYGNDISKYVQGETHINETSAMGSNPAEGTFWCVDQAPNGIEGGNLFFYDENYRKKCEESQNYTVTGDGAKSSTTSSVSSLDNFLFLGDSLTYGLKEEGGISNAKFIGVIGSSAAHWNKWLKGEKTKWDSNIDFTGKTMPGENEISGVCIMLGFNALDGGSSVDTAVKDMKEYIDKICSLYPNKPIYVEKILPCRSGVQVTNASATNEGIKKYNEQISNYCSSKGVLFIDTSEGYVGSDGQLASEKSQDGVHLKEYKTLASNITKAVTSSDVITNSEAVNVNTKGLESFTGDDQNYYKMLYADREINRVDMMNARPENYLQYLERGAQYSNHVGYSRGYMVFSYDELKRLFKERFEDDIKLPFAYGSSLGYEPFKPEDYLLKAGSVSGEISGSSAVEGNIPTVPGAVQVPDGLGKVHTWTIWNHVNEQYNSESTWPAGSSQAKLILHLTNNNERSLHGELSGDITANSRRMVCYGEWLASAMVHELGGTQGNPEKVLNEGDFIFIIQDNGTFYPVILTDTKVQFNSTYYDSSPANEWGHDNGTCMVEFQGHTSSWRDVPTTPDEFNHNIKQVYVVGNVYNNPEYLNNITKAAQDVGLNTANMINPKTM